MIVVYPMMVSNSISENTLPAVSKMLEQYILVYMQDDYLAVANKAVKGSPKTKIRYKFKGKKLIGEAYDLDDVKDIRNVTTGDVKDSLKADIKTVGRGIKKTGQHYKGKYDRAKAKERAYQSRIDPSSKDYDKDIAKGAMDRDKLRIATSKELRDIQKHKKDMAVKGTKVKVQLSDKTISLEPTYMTVETDDYGTRVLGIKVVPYRVQSDAKLSALLMHDMKIKGITAATLPMGRKVLSKIWRIAKMKGHVTGDPKQDIIYRTTGHRGETFVALDKNHDIDEYFLTQTAKIKRLFKLGWGNFVICDDALQIAHFCLRATKGMCQAMSYRMMYNTLKADAVYTDLEDLRKQNSSIFKVSGKRFSKLIGEAKADEKLYNYQERQ